MVSKKPIDGSYYSVAEGKVSALQLALLVAAYTLVITSTELLTIGSDEGKVSALQLALLVAAYTLLFNQYHLSC